MSGWRERATWLRAIGNTNRRHLKRVELLAQPRAGGEHVEWLENALECGMVVGEGILDTRGTANFERAIAGELVYPVTFI